MKRVIVWGLVGVGVFFAGLTISHRTVIRRAPQPVERAFWFRYSASLANLPTTATQVRVWVPLAKTRGNQRIVARQIQSSHPYGIHEEPTFGNELLYLQFKSPVPQRVELAIDYEAVVQRGHWLGRAQALRASEFTVSAEELALALRNEPMMLVDEVVNRLAQDATAGQTSQLKKARAIYDYVISHMAYDKTTPGWGRGDTKRACLLGKGNCTDFHSLFISMARASSISARFVIGASIPEDPEDTIPGYHCWAEFYSPEYGWVPIDASEAWKHPDLREYYFGTFDPNRLLISVGRNIQLVPAQAGPPVNILIDPYVEVDGSRWDAGKARFEFRTRQVTSPWRAP